MRSPLCGALASPHVRSDREAGAGRSRQGQALGFDTRHAHSARVYNYWLGGKDNYAADREAAEQAIAANPGIVTDVRANRAFLARVVRYLAAEWSIRQFLDIGTVFPTGSDTHGVAHSFTLRSYSE